MVKKTREDRIQAVLIREPHLTYFEAIEVVLHGKREVSNYRKNQKKSAKNKAQKGKGKRDAMYKVLSSGFELNKRKH